MPFVSDKHPRQTLEVINLLRKHRELCDVVLVVGAKKIYAHRVILSACSPYFRAMFTDNSRGGERADLAAGCLPVAAG
ncbi:kelch-like protein 20 [Stegostoma tigrinum]|uniref:kelch-like protein 20 n=1 Tax=Stegostoma tigrinum TaxID=3053191 RepID=UPI002870883A|nr:kelch-like protein 20 [Stegostoma tigrinum]